MPSERATRALIAHSQAGGPEGENADRLLGTLTPFSPFMQNALALIEDASDIDALRDVAATAAALQKGARARGMGIESENVAAEVVLRAERAMGQAIDKIDRAPGSKNLNPDGVTLTPFQQALVDIGEARMGASGHGLQPSHNVANWQTLAKVPDSLFEDMIERNRSSAKRLAKANFYALAKPSGTIVDPLVAPVSDRTTTPYATFDTAATVLLEGMGQLPDDELRSVALLLQRLVARYQQVKAERTVR